MRKWWWSSARTRLKRSSRRVSWRKQSKSLCSPQRFTHALVLSTKRLSNSHIVCSEFTKLRGVKYSTQVVAGTNYFIKVIGSTEACFCSTCDEVIHLKIHKPLPQTRQPPQIMDITTGHDMDSPWWMLIMHSGYCPVVSSDVGRGLVGIPWCGKCSDMDELISNSNVTHFSHPLSKRHIETFVRSIHSYHFIYLYGHCG